MAEDKAKMKILDRSAQVSRMMKQTAVKTKENAAKERSQQSAVSYADEKLHTAGKAVAAKSIHIGYESTRKSMSKIDAAMRKAQAEKQFKRQQAVKTAQTVRQVQTEIRPAVSDIAEQPKQAAVTAKRMIPVTQQAQSPEAKIKTQRLNVIHVKTNTFGRNTVSVQTKSPAQQAAKRNMQRTLLTKQAASAKQVQNISARSVPNTFAKLTKAVFSGIKTTVGSSAAMMTALIAGAAVSVVIIILLALTGGLLNTGQNTGYTEVSAEVQQYRPVIQQYAAQYGMSDYVELIMAVMMQESGGTGSDPMQAAEGAFNTQYPHTPNGITDPIYSIQCGIQELKSCLDAAEVQSPMDIDRISLALQGYNFGNGYISWAVDKYGGYSAANASEAARFTAMGFRRIENIEWNGMLIPAIVCQKEDRRYELVGFYFIKYLWYSLTESRENTYNISI